MKNKGILGGIFTMVLILVLVLAMGSISVSAEEPTIIASGDCGKDGSDVIWTLDSTGLLTISGEGEMTYPIPWISWRDNIKCVVIENGVTSIAERAFSQCTRLTSVTIPRGVISIGESAFQGCTGLISLTLPDSVASMGKSAFYGCTGLTEIYYNAKAVENLSWSDIVFWNAGISSEGLRVIIGDSVERIPAGLFYRCTSLISVDVPNSVTSVEEYAFYGCTGLTSVTIPDRVTSIGKSAFYGCTGLTEVYYNAREAEDLQYGVFRNAGISSGGCQVIIGDSVERIPSNLFNSCTGLAGVTVGSGATSIGDGAFKSCTGMTSLTIGSNVTSIGNSAFSGCTGLTEIIYNARKVSDLDQSTNAFYDAGAASEGIAVKFGEDVEVIPAYLFYTNTPTPEINVVSVSVGSGVTEIGECAFCNCVNLRSLELGDSVSTIGNEAFASCHELSSITGGGGVTQIGHNAFRYCSSLQILSIGEKVTTIGSNAFYKCSGIKEILYDAKAAEDLAYNSSVFECAGGSEGLNVIFGKNVKKVPANLFFVSTSTRRPQINSVTFTGNPPTIGSQALGTNRYSSWTIYAYYPWKNAAWTEDVRSAYGENIIWIGDSNTPICSAECDIEKTVYLQGESFDPNGISMTITHEDGCVTTVPYAAGLLKLGAYDFSTPGVKDIVISYRDAAANVQVFVFECKSEILDKAGYPESSHDYENDLDKTYTYTADDARSLLVTFSPQTEVETNVDYIYINGVQYTGKALAGKKIEVAGDTLAIRLVSDNSDSAYGFSIDSIEKVYMNPETVISPTCTTRGYTMHLATKSVDNYVDAVGHSFGDDPICKSCGAKLTEISLSALPRKTKYTFKKETLNVDGGKLMLLCGADKTEIDLTNDMVSGFDNTVLGKRTLTVTVGGLTTTFEVEVIERTVTSVSVENGKLAKHYSDGTTEETPLMDGTISDFMTSETGEKTMTLASENPCVVAYKDADGNYVALKTTANEDGSYSYVVPEEVTEVMVAVKGDLDGDGRINMKDLAQLRHNMAEGTVEGSLKQLIIDFNGDGVVNMKDMGILRRYLAGGYGIALEW